MHEERGRGAGGERSLGVYVLLLAAFLAVQFGHGSNIGVAVSLPGNSKAMNLALGSFVTLGVCVGLPLTPWACRTWGVSQVCAVCVVIDILVILMMLWPNITISHIYFVRFLVGFFEAPLLPYLQEWLARFGKHTWNVWNTVLHAMVPLGENIGYLVTQELVESGCSWQWAFAGQAVALVLCVCLSWLYGGFGYLDLSPTRSEDLLSEVAEGGGCNEIRRGKRRNSNGFSNIDHRECNTMAENEIGSADGDAECDPSLDDASPDTGPQVEYPVTEKWLVYWAVNASLAAQLGFLSGCKYIIRDYGIQRGFTIRHVIYTFSLIALIGPALGGTVAMSGSITRPDRWSHHKKTLLFLSCTSATAAVLALLLPYAPQLIFWPALFICFVAAGGVYPAAQGIINIALTASRVIDASVYQVQCNNILFAVPLPYVIGKCMDQWGVENSFRGMTLLQLLAASGFSLALLLAACTEERSTWHRLSSPPRHTPTDFP